MVNLDKILEIHQPKPKHKILTEITHRFSPRFYSNEDIPAHDLNTVFEAARWAPSGHNHQPWYFYFTRKGSKSYQRIFPALNEYNQSWAHTAPVLIVACTEVKNTHGVNPFAFYDLGAAVMSLVLQAQSLGYYCRQMGLFDREKVKKIIRIKPDYEPFIIIAMGKIGDYDKAPREIIDYEMDPRPRKKVIYSELK